MGILAACFTLLGAISTAFSLLRFAFPALPLNTLTSFGVTSIIGVLGLLGFLLFLLAMNSFSRIYGEHRIFSFILYGIVIMIIGFIVAAIIMFALIFSNAASLISNSGDSSVVQAQVARLLQMFMPPVMIVFGLIGLTNTVLNVWAFNLLADKSSVPLFRTGAKVMFVGSLLSIVLLIIIGFTSSYSSGAINNLVFLAAPGGILTYIAWALYAVAFFRIRVASPQTLVSDNPAI